jgi:transposase
LSLITSVVVTLVYACKELGINPVTYLTDVLSRLPTHPASRVRELTPRGWLEARRAAAAASPPTTP